MKLSITIFLFFASFDLFSYVVNRGNFGKELYWNNTSQTLRFNPANSSSLSTSNLNSILSSSSSEYQSSGFSFSLLSTSGSPSYNQNDIYFSNNSSLFGGSSILAVTQVSYSEETGEILEADVIINDSVLFSSTKGSSFYIGDVLTHELGHFVGLGHSEVHGSSMMYSLTKGQNSLHHDDISGVKHIYSASGSKEISGRLLGGSSVPIFGAHVQAISSTTGEVKAANLTESDGTFVISGLDEDTYFLYIKPLDSLSNLPVHFQSARNNFCLGASDYRGSFYESCRSSEKGKPQGIKISSSETVKNIGDISVGCDLSVSSQYMQNKGGSLNSLNIVDSFGDAGEALTGYFSDSDASLGVSDEYRIDLQNYNVPSGDIYLEIKLVSQKLYSPLRLSLTSSSETILFEGSADAYGLYYDSDGNPDLDIVGRIQLDSNSANNVFDFSVKPERLSDFVGSTPYSIDDFLPVSSEFQDDMNFYLMILTISKKESGQYTKVSEKIYNLQENSQCLDAPLSYSVKDSSQVKSSALEELEKRKKSVDTDILSCGTVSFDSDGPSSGGGSAGFLLTFLFGFLLIFFSKKTIPTI